MIPDERFVGFGTKRRQRGINVSTPASPLLSPSQLAALAEIGEERSAPVGELLYRVGDRMYPFIAILEGEVAIVDAAGNELVTHGPSGFLGELNLLSGQTSFLTAVVTQPLRYIAVDRDELRSLLFEDGPLSDLVLSAFITRREALQRVQGIGVEIVGPRSSAPPGSRTRGSSPPSVGAASSQVYGSLFARANSSIRIVGSDPCGPTISRPTPCAP